MKRKSSLSVASRWLALLIVALALVSQTPARAETLQFSGTFTNLEYEQCESYSEYGHCTSSTYEILTSSTFANGNMLSVGDSFAGSMTYSDAVPFTVFSYSGEEAVALDAVQSSTFNSGQIALPAAWLGTGGLGPVIVSNYLHGHDAVSIKSRLDSADGSWTAVLTLFLVDTTGTLLNGHEMPDANFYSQFTEGWFSVEFVRNADLDSIRLGGPIRSFAVVGGPGPDAQLQQLFADVSGVGPGKSLADTVALAQIYYAVPDVPATCAVLTDFGQQVRAQRGKKIPADVADEIAADAQAIMTAIGCE